MNLRFIMKPAAYFLLFSLTLAACNSNEKAIPQFTSIEFSYFDVSPLHFTLKVSNQDSVLLRQNFGQDDGLRNDTTYHALLTGRLKQQLDSLLAAINFSKLDSVYETDHIDGDEYRLSLKAANLERHFKVKSMSPPKELEASKELFLKIRMSFLPADTARRIPPTAPEKQVQGILKTFALKDNDNDKYYLADSVNKIFRKGFINQSPLVTINGVVYEYEKESDTVILPFFKSEIESIGFVNRRDSWVIYGKGAYNDAIIINISTYATIIKPHI